MTAVALVIAVIATAYAVASLLTGFDGDFTVAAIVAILALGVVIWIECVRYQREVRRQERDEVYQLLRRGIPGREPEPPNRSQP